MGSPDNEPLSFLTHACAWGASLLACALLIGEGIARGGISLVTFPLFGVTLFLLYGASSLYHYVGKSHPWKKVLQIFDHVMIFILIAGTYTPIVFAVLQGWVKWTLFGVVWGIALVGILGKSIPWVRVRVHHSIFVVLYACAGWLALFAVVPVVTTLQSTGTALLFTGGGLYTLGIIFFALDTVVPRTRWFGMHEIWHLFVIAGSACHFVLIYRFLP